MYRQGMPAIQISFCLQPSMTAILKELRFR
jgi:hypothetical protein